jgi:hypothetical protein
VNGVSEGRPLFRTSSGQLINLLQHVEDVSHEARPWSSACCDGLRTILEYCDQLAQRLIRRVFNTPRPTKYSFVLGGHNVGSINSRNMQNNSVIIVNHAPRAALVRTTAINLQIRCGIAKLP